MNDPPASSPCSTLSASASSTSYHGASTCTSSPSSRARSIVCAATWLVLHAISSNRRECACLSSEEIIASVDGRAEHGVIAGLCEKFRSFDQQRGRQGGAVGIEHNGTPMAALEQFAHRELQAVSEVGQPRFEQSYIGVNRVLKKGAGSRRPEGQIARNRDVACRGPDILRNIPEKCGVEGGGFLVIQGRYQPCFGPPRRGRLGHYGNTAQRRPCCDRIGQTAPGRLAAAIGVLHPSLLRFVAQRPCGGATATLVPTGSTSAANSVRARKIAPGGHQTPLFTQS